MPTAIDEKIQAFTKGKPWLLFVLNLAYKLLGVAKGREWFARRYRLGD